MRSARLRLLALSFTLILACLPARANASTSLLGDETRILDLVNRERSRARLGSLRWSDRLADLARNYSRRMARGGFFDHIDDNGDSVVERARHARISGWSKIGENLFVCESTDRFSELAIRGWMHSATHRENILDPEWSATGIGIAFARNGDIYITEVFAAD
jgi:uncharacterized protein YkwD